MVLRAQFGPVSYQRAACAGPGLSEYPATWGKWHQNIAHLFADLTRTALMALHSQSAMGLPKPD